MQIFGLFSETILRTVRPFPRASTLASVWVSSSWRPLEKDGERHDHGRCLNVFETKGREILIYIVYSHRGILTSCSKLVYSGSFHRSRCLQTPVFDLLAFLKCHS